MDLESRIKEEIERQFALVPAIGTSWKRWYDLPYRLLYGLLSRRWSGHLPLVVRENLNRALNWLALFNSLDREKVAHLEDPLYNLFLPKDEKISLPVFWVAEFFSPSYAEALRNQFDRRGWLSDPRVNVPGHEATSQLKRAREEAQGGGWSVINTWVDSDSAWTRPGAKRASLPGGIQSVTLTMFPMGSSLTAFVATFRLTDEAQQSVDGVLRADHQPRLKWQGGRWVLDGRMFTGIDAVQGERERIHKVGRDWLAEQLPGVFSREGDGKLPVLDLLLTRSHDPYGNDRTDRDWGNYLRALGLGNDEFTRLSAPEIPGVRLMAYSPERYRADDRDQWALVARYEDAFPEGSLYFNGERSNGGIASALENHATTLLSRLAIESLLELKQRRAAVSRDLAYRTHGRRAIHSAKGLRESVLRSSLDLSSIAADVETYTSNKFRYEMGLPTFFASPGIWGMKSAERATDDPALKSDEPKMSVIQSWADSQRSLAMELVKLDAEFVRLLGVVTSLNSSIEGIRSQRWSVFVAILSLAVAGAALFLTLSGASTTGVPTTGVLTTGVPTTGVPIIKP